MAACQMRGWMSGRRSLATLPASWCQPCRRWASLRDRLAPTFDPAPTHLEPGAYGATGPRYSRRVPTFRIKEAASLLGVSDDTIRCWADAGRIEMTTDAAGRRAV